MRHALLVGLFLLAAVIGLTYAVFSRNTTDELSVKNKQHHAVTVELNITYPYDSTYFPKDGIPPTFTWKSPIQSNQWNIDLIRNGKSERLGQSRRPHWTPNSATWAVFKQKTEKDFAVIQISGRSGGGTRLARGEVKLRTAAEPVGAPIFYREVPLPFIDAVKDPGRIRWRFGSVDMMQQPPVVLEKLPVCGNCHSFSKDGTIMGMDVDYANDKGSYAIVETTPQMVLSPKNIITWSDFDNSDKQPTFGLLSQVSPNGRYVVSTVKDRSIFVPRPDLAFSQLFFPLKGILAVYDRETQTFSPLKGADDPAFVHSNPTFSPDGKSIVFARAKAYDLKVKDDNSALLSTEECAEFLDGKRTFRFDLYTIPFNNGEGGEAKPLKGASNNGRSNYFAKFSPDGKWIVYCRSNSFMLLQPDSELYIVPAGGGEARRLEANRNRMNSWHSFSPNGRWLVFASKTNTPYTELFLTHIDDAGHSTPPVRLSQFTSDDRAANIPEFVNLKKDAIAKITEQFVDDVSFVRTAKENVNAGDFEAAIELYKKSLAINPDNIDALTALGGILTDMGKVDKAEKYLRHAVALFPKDSTALYNLGNALAKKQRFEEAVRMWRKALLVEPKHVQSLNNIGAVLLATGKVAEAEQVFRDTLKHFPDYAEAYLNQGNLLLKIGKKQDAKTAWKKALTLDSTLLDAHLNLGTLAMEQGDMTGAKAHLKQALAISPHHIPSLINLAIAHGESQEHDVARTVIRQARKLAEQQGRADLVKVCNETLSRF